MYRIFHTILLSALILSFSSEPANAFLKKVRRAEAPAKNDQETITRIQIFLDENNFGPGKIDGQMGTFTKAAVAHYNYVSGLESGDWAKVLADSKKAISTPYTDYKIKEADLKFVADVPMEPKDQVGLKILSYRSILEFVSERFHSDMNFIKKLNPGVKWSEVKVGSIVRVPDVSPFKMEDVKFNQHFGEQAGLSQRLVIIDTKQNIAAIWEDGKKLIATFPITPGQEKFVHHGKWTIKIMITTPEFRWDKQMLQEGKRGDEYYLLPPGPNSPVGIFWAGISKSGIGLHGTNSPETIGRSKSAGCVRFANWDAIRLSSLVRPGATVELR
jgi:lipoprotein-anchoring transpeptidase ErfK/SrfK